MNKIRNVILIVLLLAGSNAISFGQNLNDSNNSVAVSTDPLRNTIKTFSDLRIKNSLSDAAKKTAPVTVRKTEKKISTDNNISVTNAFIKGSISSLQQIKTREDGTTILNLKKSSSVIGNVAIDDADIIYDNNGIASVTLSLQKAKGAAFLAAHITKLGQPNNENVLDSFSWILGDFVLEIVEGKSNYVANYKKKTEADQFINEGVQLALR